MRYSPYPSYKPSRLPWLAEIPNEWGIHRLKWSVTGCDNGVWGEEPDGGEDDIICLRVADFDRNSLRVSTSSLTVRSVDARQRGSRKINKHDLLLEKSGGGEKQLVGCVVHFDHDFDAVCSNFVARMVVAAGLSPRFWSYVHAALYAGKLNYLAIKQTTGIQNLDSGEYLNTLVAYPSEVEQVQIAAFLDWKTGQIDALIAKKQALIEKLKEKRLAVITQAVTKGLDPSSAVRDPDIPWLDQVPEHWQVMKFGYRTHIEEGQVDPEFEPFSQMILIAPNHIESNTGLVFGLATAHEQGAISGKYLVRNGDVVYSKIRPHLNKCALSDFDGICSADMYPIRTEPPLRPDFLRYWMLAQPFLDYATVSSMRVAMPKLNRETLNAAPLLVPPAPEQEKIVEFLDSTTKRIDGFLEKTDLAISYLTEYRTALITAATTGKIDVRGWQAGKEGA
jgi:type I restriction enzyme S subunit